MNETSNKRTVIVGMFVLVGLAFLLAGILMVGNIHDTFKRKMKVVALFDDVGGLQSGNNVWFSGVKIGTVSGIRFYGQSQVAVSLKVETKAQQYIHKDAKIKVGADGLIGNKILVIYGGTANAPEIEDGDTLRVEKTFSSEDIINTLQENNRNILEITTDFKTISRRIVNGEGTVGKLLNDNALYASIDQAAISLQATSAKANELITKLNVYAAGLNKKGTLANDLTTDTVVFKSMRASVMQLQEIADTANALVATLKEASTDPNTPLGVMIHDKEGGMHLKRTLENMEKSTKTLDEDLKAAQHNFLLRRYFKKKAKEEKKHPSAQSHNPTE
ncbi:MAG TPA: MlaD family protein [Cytophagaceae bacterium]|nr:MlaD family protein [Cytophagaceae bacterium]